MSFSAMPMSGKIIDLRNLLANRFPRAPKSVGTRLITGLAFFDQSVGGGLPKGAITELITPPRSAGSASLVHAFIHTAYRDKYFVALIDGRDSFDPQSIGTAALPHLLWIRCHKASEAMQAADLLLRDGNFPLVILDLVLNPLAELRKIPSSNWYRLQRLVETIATAFVVLTRSNTVSSAQLKIVLENSWTLNTFAQEDTTSFLQVRIQRAHRSSNAQLNSLAG